MKRVILGVDEVGRGPFAGPLVVGACVLGDANIEGLTDSKRLSARRREQLAAEIRQKATVGLGWIEAWRLDEIGLTQALRIATRDAVRQVQNQTAFHEIIIDGTVNFLKETKLERYVQVLKKADLLVAEASAAAIVAKVARDAYMKELDEKYPEYGFASNVGYGTAKHREAIQRVGLCPEHRRSFAPIAAYVEKAVENEAKERRRTEAVTPRTAKVEAHQEKKLLARVNGQKAEEITAKYLAQQQHDIIARNWKNRFCEIDIVSRKDGLWYFTEVKFRSNAQKGDGKDAIDRRKLNKMRLAATMFLQEKGSEASARLAVSSVNSNFKIEDYLILE